MPLPHMIAKGKVGFIPASVYTVMTKIVTSMRTNNYGIYVHLGNIQRYIPITLYPSAPLYNIIIMFDTVRRKK